jgi:hypothetical protein
MRSWPLALWLLACTPLGSGRISPAGDADGYHAIFDAGSSGTRLLIFRVSHAPDGACRAGTARPVVDLRNGSAGLADMTHENIPGVTGHDREADADRGAFPKAFQVLAALWSRPEVRALRERIRGVALLGTGGFRDPARVRLGAGKMMERLGGVLQRLAGGTATAVAHTVEGSQEGKLAWLSARELRGGREDHAVLEIGGQTAQYALKRDGAVAGFSATVGTSAILRRLRQGGGAEVCRNENDPSTLNVDRCVALLSAGAPGLARSSIVPPDAARAPPAIWTMGRVLEAAIADVHRHLRGAGKPKVGDSIDLVELYRLAARVCSARPPAPAPAFEPVNWCYRLSHGLALVAAVRGSGIQSVAEVAPRIASLGGIRLYLGGESWPRGAAVSPDLFASCR